MTNSEDDNHTDTDDGPGTTPERTDVLVVGGGPAGAATSYWLAKAGHHVTCVERKTFPRDKTCGDGLTPRAVKQLTDMGLYDALTPYHRYTGLRAVAHGVTLELQWPKHPIYPDHGFVVRRRDLDQLVFAHAADAGAHCHQGTEAVTPLLTNGLVTGAVVKQKSTGTTREIRARYVVVADGANSRFGRALGTARNRDYPQGMAIRTYYESPLHDDPWIESALDVRDRNGNSLPGYGWIFPVGNGTINVGIGLLSTFRDWRSVNTSHLMAEWAATAPAYWGIDPDNPVAPPTGGRIPMAGSVNPKVGPTWAVVGDAAGSVNPFNGEGIDYAYETGRLVADLLDESLRSGDGMALQRYPHLLEEEYGLYFKVARLFAKVIGQPALMRELTRVGIRSRSLMDWVLRIMANLLQPDEIGPAEAAYKAAAAIVKRVPDPLP
ncbi:MAG: geranylgeranyl reductase family protein [Microthrixaceae bacterium]|nr:geranylgeranyl reductase family protein [Microthrixaceae bacterium]